MTSGFTLMALWMLLYLLHSSVLLGIGLLATRLPGISLAWKETLWRSALLLPLLTSGLQLVLDHSPAVSNNAAIPAETTQLAALTTTPAAIPAHAAPEPQTATVTSEPLPPVTATNSTRSSAITLSHTSLAIPALLSAWLILMLLGLTRVARQGWALRSLLAGRTPVQSEHPISWLEQRCEQTGQSLPRLTVSSRLESPLCLASNEICLPQWCLDTLGEEELAAVLAHELAHLQRRDPQWRLLTLLLCRLLPLQPLNLIAHRQLNDLAEFACDGAAAETGRASGLANSLLKCAQRFVSRPALQMVPAMAGQTSSTRRRVERLINGTTESGRVAWRHKLLLITIVVGVAVASPGLAIKQSNGTQGTLTEVAVDDGKGTIKASISHTDNDRKLKIKLEGRVVFNHEETDVASMDDGDVLDIREQTAQFDIRLRLRNNGQGIEREYWDDGDKQPWGQSAKSHLARLIPEIYRRVGIDVAGRTERILARGGAEAVIDEIELIDSDHVASLYISALVKRQQLSPAQLDRLLDASKDIGSDYTMRVALSSILTSQDLNQTSLEKVLDVATRIGSDYESRVLLEQAMVSESFSQDHLDAYLKVAAKIGSDYEQRTALVALMQAVEPSSTQLRKVIELSNAIGSDFEQRTFLDAAAAPATASSETIRAYLNASRHIGSDFEQAQALRSLWQAGPLDQEATVELLAAVDGIGSDHEAASLLIEVAQTMPRTEETISAYQNAASAIGSNYQRQRAESAARLVLK